MRGVAQWVEQRKMLKNALRIKKGYFVSIGISSNNIFKTRKLSTYSKVIYLLLSGKYK